jgi:hypothetical protein
MKRILTNGAISLLACFIFAELFGLGWYFLSSWYTGGHGELFYLSTKPQFSIGAAESAELITDFRLHPYFGYIGTPNRGRNGQGFRFPHDYPFPKTNERQYFIGVFGGSVAESFALHGSERLIQRLQEDPFFQKREIVMLNFGLGGYKQPQQLLILTYYLALGQTLDLVLNIDGFNEVALSNINYAQQVDISMPSVHHLAPLIGVIDQSTLTPAKVETLVQIQRAKTAANRVAASMNQAKLAAHYFVLKQLYKIWFNRYTNAKLAYEQLEAGASKTSMIYSYPANQAATDPAALFQAIATEWVNASRLMNQLLQGKNIPYFHFLQPNQYYSKKVFSVREASQALNEQQPYRVGVEQGYPVLINTGKTLTPDQVNFYDMTAVFDQEAAAIYIDDCCHYNQLGNDLLAEFIANAILHQHPATPAAVTEGTP